MLYTRPLKIYTPIKVYIARWDTHAEAKNTLLSRFGPSVGVVSNVPSVIEKEANQATLCECHPRYQTEYRTDPTWSGRHTLPRNSNTFSFLEGTCEGILG